MSRRLFASTEERLDISNEYTAIDWNLYLSLGGATIYRMITNKSRTSITCPGVMVSLMLSAWSDVAHVFAEIGKLAIRYAILGEKGEKIVEIAGDVKDIVDFVRDRSSHAHDLNMTYIKGIPNMYKELFQNYKKASNFRASEYKLYIEDMKEIIDGIKKVFCRKLRVSRPMSTAEIHDIKLFRPDKAYAEMNTAIQYHQIHNPDLYKMAESFSKWWTANVIGYLSENLEIK